MSITSRIFGTILLGLVLIGGNAWAATSSIEGVVKDPKGQIVKGAEIRIEGKGGSSWNKTTKTDAKGHFVYSGLPTGEYRVSLIVGGAVKASINNVKMKAGTPTQLNFDLKPTTGQASNTTSTRKTHKVWVPAQTGSHMGGAWVDVDDSGNPAPGASNVSTMSREAIRKMQMSGGAMPNSSAGGH